jgi:hypothetical protein
MLFQILAAVVLVVVLFRLFRLAMGLRYAKVLREEARAREEAQGRKVVAEVPISSDEVVFLLDDHDRFVWGSKSLRKEGVVGARLKVNGAVLQEFQRDGARLPSPVPPEEYEGRERWEVEVFTGDGTSTTIPCGVLREGISREVAGRVFEAVRAAAPGSSS